MSIHVAAVFNVCQPAIATRLVPFVVARAPYPLPHLKVPRFCAFSTSSRSSSLSASPQLPPTPIQISQRYPPRHPYTFHLAASWAAKPIDSLVLRSRSPFPPDTAIGMWRDRVLSSKRRRNGRGGYGDAGEDFFFVQEVCSLLSY